MNNTRRKHFDQDIERAERVIAVAHSLKSMASGNRVCLDVLVSSISSAVGAMDAYLCDKYVDRVVSVLQKYTRGGWAGELPAAYREEKLEPGQPGGARTR